MAYDIAMVLNEWEAIGVFGGNKGVSVIISLAIGLMALRFGFVQTFFSEVFPRFGIAIASLIAIVILAAVFIPNEHMKGWLIGFGVTGAVFGVIAILNSFIAVDWFASQWIYDNLALVILAVGLTLIIVAMFIWNTPKDVKNIALPISAFRN